MQAARRANRHKRMLASTANAGRFRQPAGPAGTLRGFGTKTIETGHSHGHRTTVNVRRHSRSVRGTLTPWRGNTRAVNDHLRHPCNTLGLETTQTITWHEPNQDNGDDLRSVGSPNGPGQHTPAVVWRAGPALPPPAVSLRGLQ
jgi:hypothetical protein